MTSLTAAEFITALAGVQIRLVPTIPQDHVEPGTILVWPSCVADYEDPPGRHVEALVLDGMQDVVPIMVSKRVYQALGGES